MTTLTVTLPDDTVKYLQDKAREGGHASLDAYLAAVLREIRLVEAKKKFEGKIREGIDSGPMVPVTPEFWADLEREVFEQLEAEKKAKAERKAGTKAGRKAR